MPDDELLYQIRETRTSNRFFVDNVIVDERGYGPILGAYGIAIYACLCRFANLYSQECYPSRATLARSTGMSEEQAKRVLRQLEELGLIRSTARHTKAGRQTTNLITLLDPPRLPGAETVDAMPAETPEASLAQVCQMDATINAARLARATRRLARSKDAPFSIEALRERYSPGAWWYERDWRGQKGQPPTPEAVVETWGRWQQEDSRGSNARYAQYYDSGGQQQSLPILPDL